MIPWLWTCARPSNICRNNLQYSSGSSYKSIRIRSRRVCFSQNSIWIYKIVLTGRVGNELDSVRFLANGDRGSASIRLSSSSSNFQISLKQNQRIKELAFIEVFHALPL